MLLPWTFGSPTLSRETKILRFSAGWYTSKLYQPFFLSIIFLDHLLPHFHDAMESYSTTLRFMSDFPSRQENDYRKSRESLAFQTSRRTSMRLKKKKKISWKSCLSNESVDFNAFGKKKPPKLLTEANPKAVINFRQWEGSCCHSFKKSVDSETVSAPYFHFSRKHKMNDYSFHNLISFPSLNVSDNELISIWKIRSIQLHVAPLPITLIWLFTRM